MRFIIFILTFTGLWSYALAGQMTSEYSKLDDGTNCIFKQLSEGEGQSVSGICQGLKGYRVHFAEGDLRQMVEFGYIGTSKRPWVSFSQWNHTGNTIEWRLDDGRPVATILRWFIEHYDDNTGATNKKNLGQVLVISKVGQPSKFDACVIGYVDARANKEANGLARYVADDAAGFNCRSDRPKFYGNRGPHSGNPTSLN